MVKEEEKAFFIYELDKLYDDYRKCTDLIIRGQIQEDIDLLQEVIIISENGLAEQLNSL